MAIGYDSQTTNYDTPGLAFTKPTGTVPANPAPDAGNVTELVVPMFLTAYTPPVMKPAVNVVTSSPLIDQGSNLSFGGSTLSQGSRTLPSITIEGSIDTPLTADGSFMVPALVIDGIRHHYAEFIAMCIEGRFSTTWARKDPTWFRDPYGRIFNNPIVLDFTANFIEGVPSRTSFTMRLMVPGPVT